MTILEEPVAFVRTRPRPGGVTDRGPELLPLEPGEQYRFTFDMAACVGCHSCEVACAEQNDLPVDEPWRRVGELEGGAFPHTRRFNLSIACNHCLEPTCLSGCPTNAYVKLDSGIVAHQAGECVGCEYCIWNCPYEVPVFNKARRIVSKCDMCRPRLEAGESPACVLACPTRAIGIERVDVAAWRIDHAAADAPGLPPAGITLSTTRITLPPGVPDDLVAASDHRVEPERPHWPLIVLTLLTQLSLGTVLVTVLLELAGALTATGGGDGRSQLAGAAVGAFAAGAIALAAALLHLGRPTRALKALRNLRTSWLSREVALFSGFSLCSLAYALSWSGADVPGAGSGLPLGLGAGALGIAGVYASARLYLVPARPVWNSRRTPVAFFATAVTAGPLLVLLSLDRSLLRPAWMAGLLAFSAAGTAVQLAVLARLVAVVRRRRDRQHQGTAHLLLGHFRVLLAARLAAAVAGLALLAWTPGAPLDSAAAGGRLAAALVVIALGELAGRYLFYVTVVPYRVAGSFFGGR